MNIKESGLESELINGTMYHILQKKLPQIMLTIYHRWVNENEKEESVQTLKEYVIRESEFHTIASEVLHGIGAVPSKTHNESTTKPKYERTYFHADQKSCRICNGNHDVFRCQTFKDLSTEQRWETAKTLKLLV